MPVRSPKVGSVAIKHSSVRYPDVLIFTVKGKLFFLILPGTRGPRARGPRTFPTLPTPLLPRCVWSRSFGVVITSVASTAIHQFCTGIRPGAYRPSRLLIYSHQYRKSTRHWRICRRHCKVHSKCNKKRSYRRGTARCVVSVEILPVATQQCRNYLYDKS